MQGGQGHEMIKGAFTMNKGLFLKEKSRSVIDLFDDESESQNMMDTKIQVSLNTHQ